MKEKQELKDIFRKYEVPVDEKEWQSIAHSPEVKHYNKVRHIVKAVKYSAVALCGAAVIAVVVVLLKPEKTAQMETPDTPTTIATTTEAQNDNSTVEVVTELAKPAIQQNVAKQEQPVQVEDDIHTVVRSIPEENTKTAQAIPSVKETVAQPTVIAKPVKVESQKQVVENKMTTPVQQLKIKTQQLHAKKMVTKSTTDNEPSNVSSLSDENVEDLSFPEAIENPSQTVENKFFIPSAFTPNNDGLNDVFYVKANFEPIAYNLMIFNRGGQQVFRAANMEIGWDGHIRGEVAPQGVYVYVVKYVDPQGKARTEKGQILLIP